VVDLSEEAIRHIGELVAFYEARDRDAAIRALVKAVDDARMAISNNPFVGVVAPRPYPGLAHPGRRWFKSGRYWIAYLVGEPSTITGVFFETADILGRI
jgi:plasmid stabilization system protein ParE